MKYTIYGKHPELPLFVSIDGHICRAETTANKRIKKWHRYSTHTTHSGYERISTRTNGQMKQYRIHRLVFQTFKGKIPSHLQIDHIDNNKQDNRYENLQLLTPSANTLKSAKQGEDSYQAKYTNSQIKALKVDLKEAPNFLMKTKEWAYLRKLSEKHQVSLDTIRDIRKDKSWRHINVGS